MWLHCLSFLLFLIHCPQAVIVCDFKEWKHMKYCCVHVNSHVSFGEIKLPAAFKFHLRLS